MIIVDSVVYEKMTKEEYKAMYNHRYRQLSEMNDAIAQGKAQLSTIPEVEETPELVELAEKLKDAQNLNRRKKLISDLQDLEIDRGKAMEQLEKLQPAMKKINKDEAEQKSEGLNPQL